MNNRREFLKLTGMAGLGLAGSDLLKGAKSNPEHEMGSVSFVASGKQHFNMSGYAAPKIEVVRIGFIGLGQRGPTHLKSMTKLAGVQILAICDLVPANLIKVQKILEGTGHKPELYTDHSDAWKKLCERADLDLIYISTPWDMHVPMALYAMEQGKHVAIEVPAALTIADCWKLVNTSERTRKHCMMLENCCYDFFELLTLNMSRQGFFGELIHAEGAYIHDLLELNFDRNAYWNMWRLKENGKRNGNLYPTHGLGPVCQALNINRGDKMDYLSSMSGKDFSMGTKAKELAATDPFYKPYAEMNFRGNLNTTTIRTYKGKTIMIQHDVSSPDVYSRIHKLSGTQGSALKYPLPGRISNTHKGWLSEQDVKSLEEKYRPEMVKRIGEMAKKIGGHGGMDFLMNWRLIDALRNGLPLDQDVYDAALWSSIIPLSEWSVTHRSDSVDVPDFTRGAWKNNQPVDLSLKGGGTTQVKA